MNTDLPYVVKLGKGPEQVHVNCFTKGNASAAARQPVPEQELKLLNKNAGPQTLILSSDTPCDLRHI